MFLDRGVIAWSVVAIGKRCVKKESQYPVKLNRIVAPCLCCEQRGAFDFMRIVKAKCERWTS